MVEEMCESIDVLAIKAIDKGNVPRLKNIGIDFTSDVDDLEPALGVLRKSKRFAELVDNINILEEGFGDFIQEQIELAYCHHKWMQWEMEMEEKGEDYLISLH
jgi:hypothetical protein